MKRILVALTVILSLVAPAAALMDGSPQAVALGRLLSINQPNLRTFTNGRIDRLADRVFMGAAVLNNGNGKGDWWSALTGSTGVGNDTPYAQVLVLADPYAPIAYTATPITGISVAVEAINSITNSTPRALEFFGFNNPTGGGSPAVWGLYGEAHRMSSGTGNTYGFELEIRSETPSATGWNPVAYNGGAGAVGMEIGCGAGLASSNPCTVGLYFAANPNPFAAGILFIEGSLGAYGYGSSYPAIMLQYNYEIQWFVATGQPTVRISTDTSGNLQLTTFSHVFINGTQVYCGSGATIAC